MSNISHPRKCCVTTFLLNFQISHLKSAHCIEWQFKEDRYWLFNKLFSVRRDYRRKMECCSHCVFLVPCESFESPFHCFFIRDIANYTSSSFKLRSFSIIRNWNENINLVCSWFCFVVTLYFYTEFNFIWVWLSFWYHFYWKQRLHFDVESIWGKLKLAIRRNKRNYSIILKFRKSHTLMELHII